MQLGVSIGLAQPALTGRGVVAPSNSVAPSFDDTTPTVGQTLTISDGTWSGSPSYTRQMKRGTGLTIPSATGTTYVPTSLDVGLTLTETVTATNAGGSTSANSSATSAVAGLSSFSDSFDRANENLSASANWTVSGADATKLTIVSNELNLNDTTSGGTCAQINSLGTLDHFAEATLIAATGTSFLCARMVDLNSWIGCRYVPGTGLQLFKRLSGTVTQMGSTVAHTSSTGQVMRLEISGDNATVLIDGVSKIGPQSGVNAVSPNCDRVGVCSRSSTGKMSAFNSGAVGSVRAPETSAEMIACYGDSLTAGFESTSGSQGNKAAASGRKDYPSVMLDLSNGRTVWNGGVDGQSSGSIMGRMRDEHQRNGRTYVFWPGRNDSAGADGWQTTLETNLQTMITKATAVSEARWVAMTVLNAPNEGSATSKYTEIMTYNSWLLSTYPNNSIDIRAVLVALGAPGQAYADATRYADDRLPIGLQPASGGDTDVHLNDAGYAVVGNTVWSYLLAKGWVTVLA
jgi:hypothetical protein